jgi:hypothetical protein
MPPPDSPDRPQLLDTLGSALLRRYQAAGNHGDLTQAIDQWEAAWSLLQATFTTLSVTYKLGQQRLWSTLYARLVSAHIEWSETCPEQAGRDSVGRQAMVVAESAKSRLLTDLVGRADFHVPPAIAESAARERELLADLTAWDTLALTAAGGPGPDGPAPMPTLTQRHRDAEELSLPVVSIGQPEVWPLTPSTTRARCRPCCGSGWIRPTSTWSGWRARSGPARGAYKDHPL